MQRLSCYLMWDRVSSKSARVDAAYLTTSLQEQDFGCKDPGQQRELEGGVFLDIPSWTLLPPTMGTRGVEKSFAQGRESCLQLGWWEN